MFKALTSPTGVKVLAALVALTQVLDIVIHAATNQLEVIRITSNGVIVVWLALVVAQRIVVSFRRVGFAFIGVIWSLNLIFLATQGTINPQNGQPRTALFVLVILTITLSSVLIFAYRARQSVNTR